MDHVAESNNSIAVIEQLFAGNPRLGHERLLRWKAEDHATFLRQSIKLLEGADNNSFTQLVQRLCREDSSSLKQMLFTADLLSLDESARLLRISSKNDAGYETHLISGLRAEVDRAGGEIANRDFERLLDILSQAVKPERLGGILTRLYDHPDERLRSKAALLSGRLAKQLQKQTELMRDVDPRVRANAVESLWGRTDVESLDMLRDASKDEHHRVAANGLYGLYLAGDIACVREILKMARDADVGRQLTGIWLIGVSSDFRFSQVVRTELGVRAGRVKFALLRAGRKIKQRRQELLAKPPLNIELVRFERSEKERLRIAFLVSDSDGQPLGSEELFATHFVLHDGGLRVDQFNFAANGNTKPLHAVLLLPQSTGASQNIAAELISAMEQSMDSKERKDQWAIHKYLVREGSNTEAAEAISFSNSSEALKLEQLRPAKGAVSRFEHAVVRMLSAFPDDAIQKHLVVIVDPDLDSAFRVPEHWAGLFEQHGVSAQVLVYKPLEPEALASWRQFCLARKGILIECKHVLELGTVMEKLSRYLHSGFSLTYQLSHILPQTGGPETLSIDLTTPLGCGRMVIDGSGELVPEVERIQEVHSDEKPAIKETAAVESNSGG